MDNLAHTLVGLALSKSGLETLSPATTTVCVIAANAPDLDVFSGIFGDRWTALHYHRGITHSILGTLTLALVIPLLFYLGDLMVARLRARQTSFRLRGLLLGSLIASATHPVLDWTNNYGVRLLLPWNGKWFYGDLVFIIDPFLWLIFGSAAFLLTSRTGWQIFLWSLLGVFITFLIVYAGAIQHALPHPSIVLIWVAALAALVALRKRDIRLRWGGRIALAAFALLIMYWGGLAFLHYRALKDARADSASLAAKNGEELKRLAAMPTLADPTHWRCVAETDAALYRFDLFLTEGSQAQSVARFAKPGPSDAGLIALAERDRRAQALLEFARFPLGRVVDRSCVTQTLVQFADLRYTEPGASRGNFSVTIPVECPASPPATNGR